MYLDQTGFLNTEVKADPFSLGSLIAWLEKQPRKKEYEFMNCEGGCLLGQYMASIGEPWSEDRYTQIADQMCGRYGGYTFYIGVERPRTFGAALKRARAVLAISQS